MALKLKTFWFRQQAGRDPARQAGALAAVIWRVGNDRVRNLREGGFSVAAGAVYVDILAELLAFLVVVADRIAYRHEPGPWREAFVSALTVRVGELLQDSFDDLLGEAPDGGYRRRFVALVNRRAEAYAEFDYGPDGPTFGMLRLFGHFLADAMSDAFDRAWGLDQAMTVEGPAGVELVERSMRGILGLERAPARRGEAGE